MPKPETNLYFAFPDGVLHYECAECTAICCKGAGFGGSLERHVRSLFILYPALEATVVSRNADTVEMSTPQTGCHFLEPDNRCGIETRHGKAAKPGVCTLFPFNLLRRIGSTIVVGPHFLCPLRVVVPANPGAVQGAHASVGNSVLDSGLLGLDGRGSHLLSVPARPKTPPREIVDVEVAFRDACAGALGTGRFRDVVRSFSSDAGAFDDDFRRIAAIAGLPVSDESHERDRLDDVLLAIAPTLRLEYLRLSADGVLRALALTELFVRTEATLSSRMSEPQVTFRSAIARKPCVQLLAHGDEPLALGRAVSSKVPPFGDPHLTFAAFGSLRGLAGGNGVASAFEAALQPGASTGDRVTLLMSIGTRVDPLLARRRDGAN